MISPSAAALCFCSMLLMIVATSGFRTAASAHTNYRSSQALRNGESEAAESGTDGGLKVIKLPIVQFLSKGELTQEWIMGNDMKATLPLLKQALKDMSSQDDASSSPGGYIENAYTEDMLDAAIAEGGDVILKIFRDGCKKCQKLDPVFNGFPSEYKLSSVRWIQVKSSDIPNYIGKLKERIQNS